MCLCRRRRHRHRHRRRRHRRRRHRLIKANDDVQRQRACALKATLIAQMAAMFVCLFFF